MKVILVAKKALAAYLVSSAVGRAKGHRPSASFAARQQRRAENVREDANRNIG